MSNSFLLVVFIPFSFAGRYWMLIFSIRTFDRYVKSDIFPVLFDFETLCWR